MFALKAEDYCQVGDDLIMISMNYNLIYSVNIHTGKTTLKTMLPGINAFTYRVGAKVIMVEEKLWFFPMFNNRTIWRYDINDNSWENFSIKSCRLKDYGLFQAVEYKDRIFIVGSYPAIICYDKSDKSTRYIENVYSSLDPEKIYGCFRCDCVVKDDSFYMASIRSNHVLKFNMETLQYEWLEVGNANDRYSGIDFDGEFFYLPPRNDSSIIVWDGKEKTESYPLDPGIKGVEAAFLGAVDLGDTVIFPGFNIKQSIIFHKVARSQEIVDGQYSMYKHYGKRGYISQKVDGTMTIIDDDGHERTFSVGVSEDELYDFLKENEIDFMERMKRTTKESKGISLQLYLRYLKEK